MTSSYDLFEMTKCDCIIFGNSEETHDIRFENGWEEGYVEPLRLWLLNYPEMSIFSFFESEGYNEDMCHAYWSFGFRILCMFPICQQKKLTRIRGHSVGVGQ